MVVLSLSPVQALQEWARTAACELVNRLPALQWWMVANVAGLHGIQDGNPHTNAERHQSPLSTILMVSSMRDGAIGTTPHLHGGSLMLALWWFNPTMPYTAHTDMLSLTPLRTVTQISPP